MAEKLGRIQVDTCGCDITYWVDKTTGAMRYHGVVTKCSEHASLSDEDCWNAVTQENHRKNVLHGMVMETFPTIRKQFDYDEYRWRFEPLQPGAKSRKLIVQVRGVTNTQRGQLIAEFKTKYRGQRILKNEEDVEIELE